MVENYPTDHEFLHVVPATWFIRGINPTSEIENPQERAFISRKSIQNLKSKI